MKKITVIFLFLITSLIVNVFSQSKCTFCNGYGRFVCSTCHGRGSVTLNMLNPYTGYYQPTTYTCSSCRGYGVIVCNTCKGNGRIQRKQPSFGGNSKYIKVSKSVSKCKGTNVCSCKLYRGFRIAGTNTYVGACQNYCGGGPCTHSPSDHGL